ncbi:phosphatidate cytidylyltransferase [Pseudooceanicola aestuarii]|uniref:phosphatidate cytidylyltransferase n=1 Tax=Pseudooceanicola aestuarii TaxID=2697319 RepID=UPI0013D1B4DE|nr:phosphatidate cytidylyltransferase [Pseudooceanicola aestuarii]
MAGRNWSDLAPRLISGLVMVALGLALIWAGGLWWRLGITLICGGMVWELLRLIAPDRPAVAWQLAAVAAGCLLIATLVPPSFALPLLLAPSMAGLSLVPHKRTMFLTFTAMILLAGFGMIQLRNDMGLVWMAWLVAVVVVTDIAGYFAGRLIGGPKFWPRVSPKKTWSGTVAGWVGAALTGLLFGALTGSGVWLVGISVGLSMAAQMGDMAESATKRRIGVKDSSTLIPGHGGLLDRFDGMLGASLLLLVARPLGALPVAATLPGLGG